MVSRNKFSRDRDNIAYGSGGYTLPYASVDLYIFDQQRVNISLGSNAGAFPYGDQRWIIVRSEAL